MDEFDFIELLRPLAGEAGLNLLDDAALLKPEAGRDIVLSKDTMVEGVHFPKGLIGGDFAGRLLRTALSDLAAKGADPIGYMLSVAWPKGTDPKWMKDFVIGLKDTQDRFVAPLIGGDTTSIEGPLVASVTVIGDVPSGEMVSRSSAIDGDDVWFTGLLGRAKHGLALIQGKKIDIADAEAMACKLAYLKPEPRFEFRDVLRRYANASADISDGLMVDVDHIAKASQKRVHLYPQYLIDTDFGDDYELVFTSAPENRTALLAAAKDIGLQLTRCGHVDEGKGIWVDGKAVIPQGYTHDIS